MSDPSSADDMKGPRKLNQRPLTVVGFLLTFAYLVFVVWYWRHDLHKLASLEPNTFGDFLAGTFAPLAFMWLVLGFLQQGDELRNSAEALWLQGKELQNSVEQQRELVNVTREQLLFDSQMLRKQEEDLSRSSQPILMLRDSMSSHTTQNQMKVTFQLINHGRKCTDIAVSVDGQVITSAPVLDVGNNLQFRRLLPTTDMPPFQVDVRYVDERLQRQSKSFTVTGNPNQLEFSEVAEATGIAIPRAP